MHALTILLPTLSLSFGSAEAGPLKVCLVSGSPRYQSDASLASFKAYLAANYHARCTMIKARGKEDLPGLDALDDCDVALFFTRRLTIKGEPLERIKRYCEGGRPIVAVRTASHGFQNWLEFDKRVLGGNYDQHFKEGPTAKVTVVKQARKHPVLDGIGSVTSRSSLYRTGPLATDCTCVMAASTLGSKGTQPAAWVREYRGGRVFYTSFGGPGDFENATFRRLLANALFWTARRKPNRKPVPKLATMPSPTGMLRLRTRAETPKGGGAWTESTLEKEWAVAETAMLLCDVWDQHWCQSATRRVGQMVPRMNEVVRAARDKGMLIIHAPSDTLGFYADTRYRLRAQSAPRVRPPKPLKLPDRPLPIDASDGGCDDEPQCRQYGAWTRQHPGTEIAGFDAVTDNGREVYNLLARHGIKHLIVMGVHTNMCVLGRSFGIKQMTRWGVRCVLVRDLTDTMYNPRQRPFVDHDKGTKLVVEHIEKHWCPSILSKDLLEGLR